MTRLPLERLAACCVAGWLSLHVSGVRVASAESEWPALLLGYDAPRDCPTQSEVKQAAIRLAGQTHKAQVIANVQIEKDSQGYLARVRTHEGSRQRLLRDISCTAVAEAVEVLLALAIDPDAQVAFPSSPSNAPAPAWPEARPVSKLEASSPSKMQQVPPLPPGPPTQIVTSRDPSRSITVITSALLGLDTGALPRLSEVASAQVGVGMPRWALFGAGHMWGKSKAELPGVKGMGGDFSLWTVSGTACFWIAGTLPAVDLCVGGEAGRLSGESFGVRKPGKGASLWLAPLAGISAKLPVNPTLALVLGTEVAAPLIRHGFYLQEVGAEESSRVYRPAPFSARLNFGLSLGFW
jgi:hypothetical protein